VADCNEKTATIEISLCACGAERCTLYFALYAGSRKSYAGGARGTGGMHCAVGVAKDIRRVLKVLKVLEVVNWRAACGVRYG